MKTTRQNTLTHSFFYNNIFTQKAGKKINKAAGLLSWENALRKTGAL